MTPPDTLSLAEARRVALAAQGFSNRVTSRGRVSFAEHLRRLHVLQIDSVNVFARSHYLPVFSRGGSYDTDSFDAMLSSSGRFTEYWAHEAAYIHVEDRPLFAWRMQDFAVKHAERARGLASELNRVRAILADGSARRVRELEEGPRERRGPWWDWSDTKRAVELLFATGEVATAGRQQFERRYALAAHILPEHALTRVHRIDAQRALVEQAAASLGVATLADLADYHRMTLKEASVAVRTLQEQGLLLPVQVEGWTTPSGTPAPAWLHRDTRIPSRLAANALLTPFDPIVWYRPRAERLFNFHYRIEIYTPKERRKYGYYCLPLMVQGRLVGRLDLKADRAQKRLLVQAAWRENAAPRHTAEVAAELLREAATWQGLAEICVAPTGNLQLPARLTV